MLGLVLIETGIGCVCEPPAYHSVFYTRVITLRVCVCAAAGRSVWWVSDCHHAEGDPERARLPALWEEDPQRHQRCGRCWLDCSARTSNTDSNIISFIIRFISKIQNLRIGAGVGALGETKLPTIDDLFHWKPVHLIYVAGSMQKAFLIADHYLIFSHLTKDFHILRGCDTRALLSWVLK